MCGKFVVDEAIECVSRGERARVALRLMLAETAEEVVRGSDVQRMRVVAEDIDAPGRGAWLSCRGC